MATRLSWVPCTSQPDDGLWLPTPGYDDAFVTYLGGAPPQDWTITGTLKYRPCHYGRSSSATASGSAGRLNGPTLAGSSITWPGVTVVGVVDVTDTMPNGVAQIVAAICPTADYYGVASLLLYESTGNYRTLFFRAGDSTNYLTLGSYNAVSPSTNYFSPGDKVVVIGRWDKSTIRLAMRKMDGVVYSRSNAHSFGWRNATHLTNIGGYNYTGGGGQNNIQSLALSAVFPRDIGEYQEEELLSNPWAMFSRPLYEIVGAAAASFNAAWARGANSLIGATP